MKKKELNILYLSLIFLVFFLVVMGSGFITGLASKPDLTQIAVDVNPSKGHATVTIPANAVEVAPGIFSLGASLDKGRIVEGFAIVDYGREFAKPGTSCGNGVCEPGENAKKCPADCGGGEPKSSCFDFLARGAKWKTVEDYIVNPDNTQGLGRTFVTNNFAADISKWETAASTDILGSGSSTNATLVADTESPDDKNELYFADIAQDGAIAITIVWGRFRGPPSGRELVEWDQVYDDVDFDWSSTGEAAKMDFENIATHEIGHSVGMGHPPDDCTEETMYRFAGFGETKKRTLEAGDKTGVKKLYS